MNCDFTEKVSLLIDGELMPAAAEQMRKHIDGCHVCQLAERDFLRLRDSIMSHEFEIDPIVQRQTLWRIVGSKKLPLWRRAVSVPVPVLALVVGIVITLAIWVALPKPERSRHQRDGQSGEPITNASPASTADLSRFDSGERAVIYTIPHKQSGDSAGGPK